jgi:hypothetical protein
MPCYPFHDEQGRPRKRWTCPLCGYELNFYMKDAEHIQFFTEHHMKARHSVSAPAAEIT